MRPRLVDAPKQLPGYGHAYQRLLELGAERLQGLEGRMAKAEPSSMLADVIQKDWGLCQDVDRRTLTRQLSRYRNQMVTPKMALLYEAGQGGGEAQKAKQLLFQQLSVLEEMQDLYETQKQRIQKGILTESTMPILMKDVSGEIELARKLLADIGHIHLEMGLLRRAPRGVNGFVANADGTKSSFAYVVAEGQVPIVEKEMREFIEFIDAELDYDRTLPPDAADPGSAAEGDHPGA